MKAPAPATAALLALCFLGIAGAVPGEQDPPLPSDTLPEDWLERPLPLGLAEPERELDAARAALGRHLFFDPVLSKDRKVACASCHEPAHGFASPQRFPLGVEGRRARRHPPSLFNRYLAERQLWDGRAASLEEQVLLPVSDPDEMGLPLEEALRRLEEEGGYRDAFAAVFGEGPVDGPRLAAALAEFVRSLRRGDSPIDRFRERGERAGLSVAERAGLWLYESKGGCWRCHTGRNFSDESFHNTGVGAAGGVPEDGRAAITGEDADRGAFKTPTLRGLADTAPYMHDGSLATLREVVEFYDRGGNPNSHLDPELRPLGLSAAEIDHLVAFLEALSREVTEAPGRPEGGERGGRD